MRTIVATVLALSFAGSAYAAPHKMPTKAAALAEAEGDVQLAKARLHTMRALIAAQKARSKAAKAEERLAAAQAHEHCVAEHPDATSAELTESCPRHAAE